MNKLNPRFWLVKEQRMVFWSEKTSIECTPMDNILVVDMDRYKLGTEAIMMLPVGRQDVNGVELYEGYVVQVEIEECETGIAEIVWEKVYCAFYLKRLDGERFFEAEEERWLWSLNLRILKLGNKYENPELLEKK